MDVKSVVRIEANLSDYAGAQPKKGWPGGRAGAESNDGHGRYCVRELGAGFSAGVWEHEDGAAALHSQTVDQLTFVIDGEATIVDENGRELTIKTGDGALLPNGLKFQWRQSGHVRRYFINGDLGAVADGSARGPTEISAQRKLTDNSTLPPANTYLSALPVQKIWTAHQAGGMSIGLWDSTPFRRKVVPFPRYEFMYILEGSFRLAYENGEVDEFGEGELFFVNRGANIGFGTSGYLRKAYWTFDPSAS